MKNTNFSARIHSLPAIWTKDHISFKEKICMINIFKPVGRSHDFTSKQQSVAMLNLMSSLPPIKRLRSLEATCTQPCQWHCSVLLMVVLCWLPLPTRSIGCSKQSKRSTPRACGLYRWENSNSTLSKLQLITQFICMANSKWRLLALLAVSPHNTALQVCTSGCRVPLPSLMRSITNTVLHQPWESKHISKKCWRRTFTAARVIMEVVSRPELLWRNAAL